MRTSNNRASFHLWWKKNLIKHHKASKYYENDCRYKWFSDYNCFNTKISEVVNEISDHAKYIRTQEFNKLTV